jgi:hypothetical protein
VTAAGFTTALFAWNPMISPGGTPVRWDTSTAITWNPDGGPLGKLSNVAATQMVADEFMKWESVPTSAISYTQGSQITDPTSGQPTDVTSANYNDVINANNGENPIIYDNDRDIFEFLGYPSGVVGFAGILRISGSEITKGYAVLQGDWFDDEPQGTAPSDPGEMSESTFRGMMVHEFGHFNNMGHSSVNHEVDALPGCPAPTSTHIETMSPWLTSGSLTLHHDEEAGISELYPAASWSTDYATVRGKLYDRTGVTDTIDGANVILRPDPNSSSCDDQYNLAQGMQSGVSPNENGGAGSYSFAGLTAGAGYCLLATTINDGGSYPLTPPSSLGGPDDFYNGASEDWFGPPDDPAAASIVTAPAAGNTLGGIDIKVNNAGNPGEVGDGLRLVPISGPTDPEDMIFDDNDVDSASAYGGTAQAAWINRFTPDPGGLPLQIERIDIMFWHSTVAPGRSIRLLVYHDPTGSGDPANATLVYTEDVTVQHSSTSTFNEYTLAVPFQVDAGEFYVGAYDLVADSTSTYIMSADLDTHSGRSYKQANSTAPSGFALVSDRTWMVRARVSQIAPEGSVRLTWNDACNIVQVPDQDYAVYEGSLSSLSSSPDHQSVTCTTDRALSHSVLGAGEDRYWLVSPQIATKEGGLGTGTGGTDRSPAGPSCQTVDPDSCP